MTLLNFVMRLTFTAYKAVNADYGKNFNSIKIRRKYNGITGRKTSQHCR